MKVQLFFAWFDMWVGAYWAAQKRVLYICPLPMVVIAVIFPGGKHYLDKVNQLKLEKLELKGLLAKCIDNDEFRAHLQNDANARAMLTGKAVG